MGDDDTLEIIRQAERIVWAAGWHLQEESVLEPMAGTRGLACARLEPRSDVIQLVTYDSAGAAAAALAQACGKTAEPPPRAFRARLAWARRGRRGTGT